MVFTVVNVTNLIIYVNKSFLKQMRLKVRRVILIMWFWYYEVRRNCAAMSTGIKKRV